jgi:hypothetical protein
LPPGALTVREAARSIKMYVYSMAKTTEEDMNQLERDIRQLKIEYEQYFGGGKKRPPTELEWRIDVTMKRYSDRGSQMNFAQRFRYSNLAQMYTKYREIFRKRMKQKEEGSVQRHFGAAAREIENLRKQKQAAEPAPDPSEPLAYTISFEDPNLEQKKVEDLYAAFRHAKERAGEDTGRLTLAAFQQFVRQKTGELKKQERVRAVEFIVTVEGKHAHLKARVKS